jgi:hypothetical protein
MLFYPCSLRLYNEPLTVPLKKKSKKGTKIIQKGFKKILLEQNSFEEF